MSNSSTAPLVSVIVPAFNEPPARLRLALESLANQSFGEFECLLIDESTAPDSVTAADEFCRMDGRFVRIVPETRLGLAGSLNLGLSRARGAYIARFDSDDLCCPDRLGLQLDFLEANPAIGILGGGIEIISEDGRHLAERAYPVSHEEIAKALQFTTPLAHPTVMMRRSELGRAGGYDPNFRYAEDLDLWLRLLSQGTRFANLPDRLVRYRQTVTTRSRDHWKFNLAARTKNFSRDQLLRRAAGIAAIAVWAHLPTALQKRVFNALLLTKGAQS